MSLLLFLILSYPHISHDELLFLVIDEVLDMVFYIIIIYVICDVFLQIVFNIFPYDLHKDSGLDFVPQMLT